LPRAGGARIQRRRQVPRPAGVVWPFPGHPDRAHVPV